jgi:hypothetical protein
VSNKEAELWGSILGVSTDLAKKIQVFLNLLATTFVLHLLVANLVADLAAECRARPSSRIPANSP